MAHKVVKYRLEADGTIPMWLTFGVPQSTGGMYAVADPNTASPQDWMMIGISAGRRRYVRCHHRFLHPKADLEDVPCSRGDSKRLD
jgi:hypothetical protein